MKQKYGRYWDDDSMDLEIELACFRDCLSEDDGGLGTYGHLRKASDIIFGKKSPEDEEKIYWTPWFCRMIKAFCDEQETLLGGCMSSGKSGASAFFSLMYYLADPANTLVLVTSMSISLASKRIFKDIQRLWNPSMPGSMVASLCRIKGLTAEGEPTSVSSGIHVVPCGQNFDEAMNNFKGIKSKRLLVIYDELGDLPLGLVEAWKSNMKPGNSGSPVSEAKSSPNYRHPAKLIAAYNPASRIDAFGIMCEPVDGWDSIVQLSTKQWRTKSGGLYLRFDARYNPRITHKVPEWSFYPTEESINEVIDRFGEHSRHVYSQVYACFSDGGNTDSLISEDELIHSGFMGRPVWGMRQKTRLAALDPAFTQGGDRCILHIADFGYSVNNIPILEIIKTINIKQEVVDRSTTFPDFLAQNVQKALQENNVSVNCFATDNTGAGISFSTLLSKYIGKGFHLCNFGGSASVSPLSNIDKRPANVICKNRVSELWQSVKQALRANQLFGGSPELCRELSERSFRLVSKKIQIETKKELKNRTGKSPDLSDALVVLIDLAKTKFNFNSLQATKTPSNGGVDHPQKSSHLKQTWMSRQRSNTGPKTKQLRR